MRVTIISDDSAVYVDGLALKVDLTGLSSEIHAVQWYDTFGDVEFVYDPFTQTQLPNQRITDISPYQVFIDRHTAEKALLPVSTTPVSTAVTVSSTKVIVL